MKRCVTFALLGVLTTGTLTTAAAAPTRPNIVFIYADDHSEAAISAYGSKINQTPNIDRLAYEGMRFTQSFVANSICGPARATILTGTHSHINGKTTNRSGFNDNLPTFAKLLQKAGYQTATMGKWHLPTKPSGFDFWAKSGGYYLGSLQTSEGVLKRQGYTTDVLTDLMHEWIDRRDPEKPFAVWLSHNAAHRVWMPPTRHLNKYDGDWELYDLQNDPDEIHNIYDDPKHASLVASLKTQLTALRKQYKEL